MTTSPHDVSAVVDLLRVKPLGGDRFRGGQPDEDRPRMFGGQIAAQALMAAAHTVPGRLPHSVHLYFLRRGDVSASIDYHVSTLRDGGAISVRRVSATQAGTLVVEALISFADDIDGPSYQRTIPSVPDPETLTPLPEQLAPYAAEHDGWWVRPRPFDFRYITRPARIALEQPPRFASQIGRLWFRATDVLPDDPVLHSCLLTYVSDMTLLDPVMVAVGRTSRGPGVVASVDHALWFHRAANLNDWILYDQESPNAAGGTGLATAAMFDRSGRLLCHVVQDGYLGRPT